MMRKGKEIILNVLANNINLKHPGGMRYLYYCMRLFTLLLCISCNNSKTYRTLVEDFPNMETLLEFNIHECDTLYNLYDLSSTGDYLICAEKKRDYFFTLFDKDFNKVCSFARKGRGANEYIAPAFYGQYTKLQDTLLRFLIFDRALNRLDEISIDVKNGCTNNIASILKLEDHIPLRTIFLPNTEGCIGVTDYNNCKIYYANSNFSNFTTVNPSIDIEDKASSHPFSQNISCINEDGMRMAVAYYNFPVLDIYSSNGELVKNILLNNQYIKPNKINEDNMSDYFYKIIDYDNKIFSLYNNPEHDAISHILVFDWDGNPIVDYTINRATAFTIFDNKIITINENSDNSMCSVYEF